MPEDRRTASRSAEGSGPLAAGARLAPPRLDRGQIARPRLLGVLAQRWDRRATLVVAGAGFGKSTLIGQALAENAVAPRGLDLWLSLTPGDADGTTLLHALTSLLAGAFAPETTPEPTLATALSQLSAVPPGTCLVLDDVHAVPVGSSGHRVLERVVGALPLQCSLLLGSRTEPVLPLAEWRAKGLVETITETALAYDDGELAQLAAAKGRRSDGLGDLGGWPALVELSLAVGRDGSEPYLRQVVLDRLSPRQQRWLGAIHAIGGGDFGLVAAALDETGPGTAPDRATVDEFTALGSVPAMQVMAGGGFQPHALWNDTLAPLLPAEERRDAQRRAAAELLRRLDHDGAIELYRRCDDVDGMCAAVVDSCATGTWRYPVQTLQRWRDLLPTSAADRPEATLLAALTAREGATFDPSVVPTLLAAAAAFRERGDTGAESAVLAELAFVAREQGNTDAFTTMATRMFELHAQGHREVEGFVALIHATLAEAADLDQLTIDALADLDRLELPRQWRSRAHWLRAHSTVMLGRPDDAAPEAALARSVAEDDFLGGRYLMAYIDWWSGVDARTVAELPFIGDEAYRTPFDCVYGGGIFAALHAFAGNVDIAERSLAIAVEASGAQGTDGLFARPEYLGILQSSRAAIEVARGDEEAAAAVVRAFFADHAVSTPIGRRVARRLPALVQVLVPTERDALAAAPFGPAHHDVLAIGRWFTALREGVAEPPPPGWRQRLLNALPMRWAVEAAIRWLPGDERSSIGVVEQLVDLDPKVTRALLRSFSAEHPEQAVRDGARRLLGAVPIRPDAPVRLALFGPMHVGIGTALQAVDHPLTSDARALIAALAALGPAGRHEVAASLWPTSSDPIGSLDAAVATAHDVLEPHRRPGDAPFLLRDQGGELSLAPAPWLETDLGTFHHTVERALEAGRSGSHSSELDHLEEALALVVGRPLPDLTDHPPAAATIASTLDTVVSAGQRAAGLRFARGHHADARRHAARTLGFDPSNEACHQITVASFADEGRIAAALDALAAWRSARSDLGLGPSLEMSMLARRLGLPEAAVVDPPPADAPPAAELDVRVLGRFAATIGHREANIPGGKPQELVKLLAVSGRSMPEDEVCDVLWPDVEPDIGRRRLRNVIARVRASGPFVERGDGQLALADVVSVDLHRFDALARGAVRDGGGIDAVFAEYGGELLPGDRFVEWTAAPRERVRALALELLERHAERALRDGDIAGAVATIDRLLDVDPYADHWAERAADSLRAAGQAAAAARWNERAIHLRNTGGG